MEAVLNWLWQGGVIAVVSFVLLRALERARANVRYLVCWTALAAVIVLPILPSVHLPVVSPDALQAPQRDALVSLPDTWWTSTLVLLGAWLVWVSVHAVRFAAAVVAIRRARAGSVPFPSTIQATLSHWGRIESRGRRAALVLSHSVSTAAVLGWGTPMIAVSPSLVETLDSEELDRVLIHEWAHVQRRDDLVNVVQIVVRAAVGWHPALWWIDRRVHVEREIACDEVTVAVTGSPKTYATCLMKLASLRSARTLQAAPAVLAGSGLRARIVKIVSAHHAIAPLWSRSIAAAVVTALCLTSMALGSVKLVHAAVGALPVVAPPAAHRMAPIAVPIFSSDIETDRSPRRASGVAAIQHPSTQAPPLPLPQPTVESKDVVTLEGGHALDVPVTTGANPEPIAIPVSASLPNLPAERSDVTPVKPRAPWSAAADGGVAIGRTSKNAGVATAGFFTRVARGLAGSF